MAALFRSDLAALPFVVRLSTGGITLQPLLKVTSVTKHFGGVRALKGVSFELNAGEVHALVGENGAGKSTLIKLMTGALASDSGTIELEGLHLKSIDPAIARKLGIAVVYQQPALFPDLTVTENISLRLEHGGLWRILSWRDRRRKTVELLQRVGAEIPPDELIRHLTMPQQQLVEIASALGSDAKVLILDEPTASLTDREVTNLFRVIRQLKSEGVGMIYISHRLEELPQIADRVTVLRDGSGIGTKSMADVDRAELIRLMVGRDLSAVFPKIDVPLGDVVLETQNLSCRDSGVDNVSLTVRAGEILGLAGLVGAGRTELARVLFGLTPADSGKILLRGKPVTIDSPGAAIALGIAYVPEDRRRHGVVLEMSVAQNTTLATLRKIARAGLIDFEKERQTARYFVDRLGTKTPTVDVAVCNLSGGNQQKVALARWLAAEPAVIILDEPTQGVDVGAKSEIHRLMSQLAGRGQAIIMISSELPEVLGMSDRIAVMHGGAVTGILSRSGATQERVLELAMADPAACHAAA
jgi:rhamnose transport system ATP-binding protein